MTKTPKYAIMGKIGQSPEFTSFWRFIYGNEEIILDKASIKYIRKIKEQYFR